MKSCNSQVSCSIWPLFVELISILCRKESSLGSQFWRLRSPRGCCQCLPSWWGPCSASHVTQRNTGKIVLNLPSVCQASPLATKLTYSVVTAAASIIVIRATVSRLLPRTKDQWLSRKFPGLQQQIGTAEAPSLVDWANSGCRSPQWVTATGGQLQPLRHQPPGQSS